MIEAKHWMLAMCEEKPETRPPKRTIRRLRILREQIRKQKLHADNINRTKAKFYQEG